jgi:hypothetical protein
VQQRGVPADFGAGGDEVSRERALEQPQLFLKHSGKPSPDSLQLPPGTIARLEMGAAITRQPPDG